MVKGQGERSNGSGTFGAIRHRVLSPATLVSFGVAVALVVFLATRFELDWGAAWQNVQGMDPFLYVLAFLLYYLSFSFRGLRWRLLAANASGNASSERLPSAFTCAQLIVSGWFVNAITWLRLGDAYRAYAFSEESERSFSWSLGTVLAERVIDMTTVFAILVVSAAFLSSALGTSASAYILGAAFGLVFATLAMVLLMRVYGATLARRLPRRLARIYHRFHQGTLGSFKRLHILVLLGLAGWMLEVARLYFVVQALDIEIALALVPVVALGHALLTTVPTPGGVGAVEPGVTGLLLISLERHDAVSVALVDRSITYVSVIVVGGLVFVLRRVTATRRRRARDRGATTPAGRQQAAD